VISDKEERCIATVISFMVGFLPSCPASLSNVFAPAASYDSFNGGSPVPIFVPRNGSVGGFNTAEPTLFKHHSDSNDLPTCVESGMYELASKLGVESDPDETTMRSDINGGQTFLQTLFANSLTAVAGYLGDFSSTLCTDTSQPCTLAKTPVAPFATEYEQFCGPFGTFFYFADLFQLQYVNNMVTAFGGITTASQLLEVSNGYWFLENLKIDYQTAASLGSEFAATILASIDLAVLGYLPGSVAADVLQHGDNPAARMVYLSSHHEQIMYMRQLLNLQWTVTTESGGTADAFSPNQPVLGGLLSFEVMQDGCTDASCSTVQVYYTVQTPDQMRNARQLDSSEPPSRVGLFIPDCAAYEDKTTGACNYLNFRSILLKKIRTNCIYNSGLRTYVSAAQAGCSGTDLANLACPVPGVPGSAPAVSPAVSASGLSTGAIVGIVLACVISVIGWIVWCFVMQRANTSYEEEGLTQKSDV